MKNANKNFKILISDDEPYIVHVLAIKLSSAGYEILTASDGEEALEICRTEKPDMIITDYQMPHCNGLQLCDMNARENGYTIPAILITAREYDIDEETAHTHGIREILAKPFSPNEVLQKVETLLEEYYPQNNNTSKSA